MQKIADVRSAIALMSWDQETYLPGKGAMLRGRQLTTLSILAHQLATDAGLENLLQALSEKEDLDPVKKKNVSLCLEDFHKAKKYPPAFVERLSQVTSAAYHAWIQGRRENSFAVFEPLLKEMVNLKKQEADLLGFQGHPYNALLNEHEKGMTTVQLDRLFNQVKLELGPLIRQIAIQPVPDAGFLHRFFPGDKQWQFGTGLLKEMGFDFEAGRQDISVHPFTTSFGNLDVRITTRIDEQDFAQMTWSCLHEGGHALYEQGLNGDEYGLPAGEPASLGVHESQSRLWENWVGRSRGYWEHHFPELQILFPESIAGLDLQDYYRGINRVIPTLIRTEADELTYHFHVLIRYEIEKDLIGGKLCTADLPDIWKEKYSDTLGVKVVNDIQGVLQDVHWSHGSFGYFPTYSLGSFLAAQLFAQAEKDLTDLPGNIRQGNLSLLLGWLRKNIHSRGRLYPLSELCQMVTGEELDFRYFMDYALRKFGEIYELDHYLS